MMDIAIFVKALYKPFVCLSC